MIFPELVLDRWLGLHGAWGYVLFAFAAIAFARHPEGLLEHGKRRSQVMMQRAFGRRQPAVVAAGAAPGPEPAANTGDEP